MPPRTITRTATLREDLSRNRNSQERKNGEPRGSPFCLLLLSSRKRRE
jgi:hypothetical protein